MDFGGYVAGQTEERAQDAKLAEECGFRTYWVSDPP